MQLHPLLLETGLFVIILSELIFFPDYQSGGVTCTYPHTNTEMGTIMWLWVNF